MTCGTLYVVATPIGNLSDVSPRALEVLAGCDTIACEDTRTSRTLLARHGIGTRVVALHAHNERRAGGALIEALCAGRSIALISDAGTPAVSDPGAWLVAAAHQAGIRVLPVPGPNAAVAAWSAAGFSATQFLFVGFLPASGAARRKALAALDPEIPLILYEAPHRVLETVADLGARFGPARELLIARELTKKFEETARLPLGGAPGWLTADPNRQLGEFVLVLGPGEPAAPGGGIEPERVLRLLIDSLPASEAARLAARITGAPRKALYASALKLRRPDRTS